MAKPKNIAGFLARHRLIFQILFGVTIYLILGYFQISIWWIVAFGSFVGILWGKVFCRWMCPVGIFMELLMKMNPNESFRSMYQYHKIGCPIAWISGIFNKYSLYKITLNRDTCKKCGLCDQACYMPSIDPKQFSLYKKNKINPAENFSCSKCLKCVQKCPNGSLKFKPVTR